jgi:hypothetical protein
VKTITLVLVPLVALACMVAPLTATPISVTNIPATNTPTPAPVSGALRLVTTTITTVTDLHLRECAAVSCAVTRVVLAGTQLTAVCSGDWCVVSGGDYFCLPAAIGTGGCNE